MRALLAHIGLSVLAIVLAGVALTLAFSTPADRKAIEVSATIAFVLQFVSFALLRAMRRKAMVARGIGALARLVALVVYALVVVRGGPLPPNAALISFVVFLFLTTLIEPLTVAL
jgi:hypothetical protein